MISDHTDMPERKQKCSTVFTRLPLSSWRVEGGSGDETKFELESTEDRDLHIKLVSEYKGLLNKHMCCINA